MAPFDDPNGKVDRRARDHDAVLAAASGLRSGANGQVAVTLGDAGLMFFASGFAHLQRPAGSRPQ